MTSSFSYYTFREHRRRTTFLKCLTFFLTTFLILIGVALFGAIGLVKLRYSHPGVNVPDVCVITLASLMCVVALLGYWSTCHNNSVLVKLFIAALVVVTSLIIMIDVVLFTQPELTRDILINVWPQLNDHGRIQFQKLLHCCDVTSAASGNRTRWASSYHRSCFEENEDMGEWLVEGTPSRHHGAVQGGLHHSWKRRLGCFSVVIQLIHDNLYLISGVIGGVIILNIVLVLLSCATLVTNTDEADKSRSYSSFPVVTDVILWKRRTKRRLKEIESGIFELPPTYPTEPILQAYKNSIEKSLKYYEER